MVPEVPGVEAKGGGELLGVLWRLGLGFLVLGMRVFVKKNLGLRMCTRILRVYKDRFGLHLEDPNLAWVPTKKGCVNRSSTLSLVFLPVPAVPL